MEPKREERHILYRDPLVEKFLTNLSKEERTVEPKFDLTYGYRYPEVEKIIEKDPKETKNFLEKLAQAGILDKKLHGMSLGCPICKGLNVSTYYACPFCGSIKITKKALIEHTPCGYIGNISKFKTNDELVCPKCGEKLTAENQRSAGVWFECSECGKHLETLNVIHFCRECKKEFTFEDALYKEVYSYSLSKTAKEEVERGLLLFSSVRKLLKDLGYNIIVPGKIKGESGVEHEFDIVAIANHKPIAIDIILSDKPITRMEIVRKYVKIFDAKIKVYIIAIPKLDSEASDLASSYKINVIEAESPEEAVSKLKDEIKAKAPTPYTAKGRKENHKRAAIGVTVSIGVVAALIAAYFFIPQFQTIIQVLIERILGYLGFHTI